MMVAGVFTAFAEEPSSGSGPPGLIGIGAGLGVRNGFVGVGLELSPVEYIAVTAGAGFLGINGYNVGLQVFPMGRTSKVRPWFSVSGGQVLAVLDFTVGEMSYVAYGAGGEVGFNSHHTLDFGIDLINGDDSFIFPSLAYKYHF
jgi:hypothetical protein